MLNANYWFAKWNQSIQVCGFAAAQCGKAAPYRSLGYGLEATPLDS
jgi:hypothetical protein